MRGLSCAASRLLSSTSGIRQDRQREDLVIFDRERRAQRPHRAFHDRMPIYLQDTDASLDHNNDPVEHLALSRAAAKRSFDHQDEPGHEQADGKGFAENQLAQAVSCAQNYLVDLAFIDKEFKC
ncbi:hypothetical protein [Acidisarcina polymorpha]|uniref:hypothetical protein n=1 Tax=Acidisarcina polymorpha TaxID=2211140 RepID=UPI001375220E|nr:hypothetical protein [Acidisarcina polymorpha]